METKTTHRLCWYGMDFELWIEEYQLPKKTHNWFWKARLQGVQE